MAKLKYLQNTSSGTKDVNGKVKDLAQTTYEGARDIAQTTYESVQHNVKPVISKTQAAFLAGLGLAQGLIAYNQKKSRKDIKWARKNMKKKQKQLQTLQSNIRENLGSGWLKALAMMQAGLGLAQIIAEKNKRDVSKNIKQAQKKARKNLKEVQGNLGSGWDKTQRIFGQSAKSVGKPLSQATESAKDMRDVAQKKLARYKRRRRRARTIFRVGLLVGVILALLYAPFPGSEMRQRIASRVEQYRAKLAI